MRLVQLLPPVGFAVGYVLISFSATPTPLTGLPRPLLVAAAAALILAVILALLTRDVRIGSILASALVVLASAMWLPVLIVACVALWIAPRRNPSAGDRTFGGTDCSLAPNRGSRDGDLFDLLRRRERRRVRADRRGNPVTGGSANRRDR